MQKHTRSIHECIGQIHRSNIRPGTRPKQSRACRYRLEPPAILLRYGVREPHFAPIFDPQSTILTPPLLREHLHLTRDSHYLTTDLPVVLRIAPNVSSHPTLEMLHPHRNDDLAIQTNPLTQCTSSSPQSRPRHDRSRQRMRSRCRSL